MLHHMEAIHTRDWTEAIETKYLVWRCDRTEICSLPLLLSHCTDELRAHAYR